MTKRKAPEDLLPLGRPTLYKPEFCDDIIRFFDREHFKEVERKNAKSGEIYYVREANKLPTLAGFANSIGVGKQTLYDWSKAHPDFSYSLTRAKALAEDMLVNNALSGLVDSKVAVFVAKNYTDLRDVKEVVVEERGKRTLEELEEEARRLDAQIALLESQI